MQEVVKQMAQDVTYKQGMTTVWSDGEKITVVNEAGIKWVKDNVEQIFGMGEWDEIHDVVYFEIDYARDHRTTNKGYECISGYIPQRVRDDLTLPEDVEKANALDALKDV